MGFIIPKLKFSKASRLQTPADYQAVFNQPISSRSPYFTVLARPNNRGYARLGIIVAKRLVNRAVHRNAIRRLIRESFRVHQRELSGLDVIVLGRHALLQWQLRVFYDCLTQQWKDLRNQWQKG